MAVDIASDGVRMLQFHRAEDRLDVCAGAQWKAAQGARLEENHLASGIVHAVRDILSQGGFLGRQAVSSIGAGDLHIETLRLPKNLTQDAQRILADRAQRLFPFDVDASRLMVRKAGMVIGHPEPTEEYILLAAPEQTCARREETLRAMGLTPVAIDMEPLALVRALHQFRRREDDRLRLEAMVHQTPDSTLLVVAHAEHILLIKNLDRGGNRITAAAAQQLGLSFAEADLLRRQLRHDYASRTHNTQGLRGAAGQGTADDSILWTVHDAVRDELDALVLDIGLCLRYCSTTFGCPAIHRVVLAGEAAGDPSLIHLLHERLNVECFGAVPLRGVDMSNCPLFSDRRRPMADWTICAGLACWSQEHETNTPASDEAPADVEACREEGSTR